MRNIYIFNTFTSSKETSDLCSICNVESVETLLTTPSQTLSMRTINITDLIDCSSILECTPSNRNEIRTIMFCNFYENIRGSNFMTFFNGDYQFHISNVINYDCSNKLFILQSSNLNLMNLSFVNVNFSDFSNQKKEPYLKGSNIYFEVSYPLEGKIPDVVKIGGTKNTFSFTLLYPNLDKRTYDLVDCLARYRNKGIRASKL